MLLSCYLFCIMGVVDSSHFQQMVSSQELRWGLYAPLLPENFRQNQCNAILYKPLDQQPISHSSDTSHSISIIYICIFFCFV